MLEIKDLLYLSKKQEELDEYIMTSKKLSLNEEIDNNKIIALIVEISEFINECRAFKYWSNKPSSDKSIVLEEFVDSLHFIISIGNDIVFNFSNYKYNAWDKKDINYWSIEMYKSIMSFQGFRSHKNYSSLLNTFMNCMNILDFSSDDVLNSYNKKNETNFKRQDNNY
ncbi:dUTP diphosphatase [Spiroplasma litorale]|uniref:dUTP diphosphatase n=1 Tax=Spiroplasma litorale TaxID=216942 RepID=A0A0K1W0P8_9MOLU|nr:dUTP diphosphatase [Spiroplasma litorale]AKX33890.1 dUTP diphosphatase [Spiroplasma litorale]